MTDITSCLGAEAESLLGHVCAGIPADSIYPPGPDYIDDVVGDKQRKAAVLRNLGTLFGTGRLAGSG